jgi:chromosome segregation ATPase
MSNSEKHTVESLTALITELNEEYAIRCSELGDRSYRIGQLTKEVNTIQETLQTLNKRGAKLHRELQELKMKEANKASEETQIISEAVVNA